MAAVSTNPVAGKLPPRNFLEIAAGMALLAAVLLVLYHPIVASYGSVTSHRAYHPAQLLNVSDLFTANRSYLYGQVLHLSQQHRLRDHRDDRGSTSPEGHAHGRDEVAPHDRHRGAGTPDHLYDGLMVGGADAVLAASIFHFGNYTIQQVKDELRQRGVPMR